MSHIMTLFDCARNPRDELLLLFMFCGGERVSEPLHHFRSDIEGQNSFGELLVRMADPRTGLTEWMDDNGVMQYDTRDGYFEKMWRNEHLGREHKLYRLRPRDTYGLKDPLYVGFKGMTFHDSDGSAAMGTDPLGRLYDVNYMWWIDPRVGARAQIAYENYRNQCLLRNYNTKKLMPEGWLNHPWLFINLEAGDNYGEPMSYAAIKALWTTLLERLYNKHGIDLRGKKLRWHSLRHFYGWYCANVLEMTLQQTAAMMHHGSMLSTEVYFKLSAINVRAELTKKFLESKGFTESDIDGLIIPGTPKLEFPDDWMNSALRRQLMLAATRSKQKQILR